jgi:hypothetical protein
MERSDGVPVHGRGLSPQVERARQHRRCCSTRLVREPRKSRYATAVKCLYLAGVVCALAVLVPRSTQAQPQATTSTLAPPAPPERKHRIEWRFPRFRWWEYAAAGAVTAGNLTLEHLYDQHPRDRWTSPILLDAPVRKYLRADPEGQRRAAKISDLLWYGSTYYVLADGIITPLASDRFNYDVAFQLTLLNWQAIGTSGLIARMFHVTVGRTRPSLQGCSHEEGAENPCEFRGASFLAGHTMMTSANAGLACANHRVLPLYGGGVPDRMVCPLMVSVAIAVGALRIIADKHWLSDDIAGWALGGAIGYGMPTLLHYRHVQRIVMPLPRAALLPWGNEHAGGLQFMGWL